MKTIPATDFYPSPCTYTGDKVVRHRCASLLQCRTTLALLRSALRRGRFIPEIYFLLKRPPKTVLSSRSDVPSRFLHGQVLRFKVPPSCSLKNEFAPGTKGGELGSLGRQRGRPLWRNARSYYFTWTLAWGAHVKTLRGSSSFRHFFPTFFVRFSLELVDL